MSHVRITFMALLCAVLTLAAESALAAGASLGVVELSRSFPRVVDGRYVVFADARGALHVIDDTRRRTLVRTLPDGCTFEDLALPEALLSCPRGLVDASFGRTPLVLDLVTGEHTTFPASDQIGWHLADVGYHRIDYYSRLGSVWLLGLADTVSKGGPATVYLHRKTGERRMYGPLGDIDTEQLTPLPPVRPPWCDTRHGVLRRGGPSDGYAGRRWLVVARCGRSPLVLSKCRAGCDGYARTSRHIAWWEGRRLTVLRPATGRRTHHRFRDLRRSPELSWLSLAATTRRFIATYPTGAASEGGATPVRSVAITVDDR